MGCGRDCLAVTCLIPAYPIFALSQTEVTVKPQADTTASAFDEFNGDEYRLDLLCNPILLETIEIQLEATIRVQVNLEPSTK